MNGVRPVLIEISLGSFPEMRGAETYHTYGWLQAAVGIRLLREFEQRA